MSTTRKQLDPRLRILIENNVKTNHRSFIVLVGDRGRDRIPGLYYLLSHARDRLSSRRTVLWCYKKELGFSSHRKKREQKSKQNAKLGKPQDDEFDLFINSAEIRYTYYKETEKVLGQTFEMCILQDFEAITPNLLARTIETVEGGGLVIITLKTMSSLKQLYTMTMDVHSRYRSSSGASIVARFNERFILSLGSCDDCLVLDDELNVLPISRGKDIMPLDDGALKKGKGKAVDQELASLRESLDEDKVQGPLVKLAKTIDQAQAVLTFVGAIKEKTLSSTVTLTAARGRGKSAALGLAVAAAVAHGYSNIFITSPSPENLKTFWQFVGDGMKALGYVINVDYDAMESTNPEFKHVIVRVNIYKTHRQTIQWIQPQDAHVLGQAELVIIDEAAAIPLPLVKNLLGPYLVFMASTVNGYEGTGRSLSLKLIQQLRESTRPSISKGPSAEESGALTSLSGTHSRKSSLAHRGASTRARTLKEIQLTTPIRYSADDKIEKWLNGLLCLDATAVSRSTVWSGSPKECNLYAVSRDTLFSYHPASELFLQRMMALYVASHYKNQPNDLQLMSDAPAHQLFVLLPPVKDDETHLPDPLVVLQVALEGDISKAAILDSLSRGLRSGGDLIPWLISQQFQENKFAQLSGARVVRIAVHPDHMRMGFGARALEALNAFYSGDYVSLDEVPKETHSVSFETAAKQQMGSTLLEEHLAVRNVENMPPLLQRLSEVQPPALDYLGVSYGLTASLLKFWKKSGYVPLYVRQTPNDLTGEFTTVMVRGVGHSKGSSKSPQVEWLTEFAKDFRKRFLSLLSFRFREFGSVLGLQVIEAANSGTHDPKGKELTVSELLLLLSPFDVKRLESYANNQLDYHVILDLLPTLATLYFDRRMTVLPTDSDNSDHAAKEGGAKLSALQSAMLLAMGLQRKTVEEVGEELSLDVNQVLAQFAKIIKKVTGFLQGVQRISVLRELPQAAPSREAQTNMSTINALEEDLADAAQEARKEIHIRTSGSDDTKAERNKLKERQREMLGALDLSKFAINDGMDWSSAEAQVQKLAHKDGKGKGGVSSIVSVKGTAALKRKADSIGEDGEKSPKDKKTRRGGKKAKH